MCQEKECMDCIFTIHTLNDACMPYIFKILLKIRSLLIFLANGRACCRSCSGMTGL